MVFIGFDKEGIILLEAERLGLLKNEAAKTPQLEEERNKKRKEQEGYLHKRIIEAERKRPYHVRMICLLSKFVGLQKKAVRQRGPDQ